MKTETITPYHAFKTAKEAEEHAAYMVAIFWLGAANRILERGETPLKLSKCSLQLSQDEMDRDIYRPFNFHRSNPYRTMGKMEVSNIARQSIQIALAKLRIGAFPKVRRHFEVESDHDSSKFATICMQRIGEIES